MIAVISAPSANPASIKLHTRFGFVQRGHLPGIGDKLGSAAIDVDIYQLDLAGSARAEGKDTGASKTAASASGSATAAPSAARIDISSLLKAKLAQTGVAISVHSEPGKA